MAGEKIITIPWDDLTFNSIKMSYFVKSCLYVLISEFGLFFKFY